MLLAIRWSLHRFTVVSDTEPWRAAASRFATATTRWVWQAVVISPGLQGDASAVPQVDTQSTS